MKYRLCFLFLLVNLSAFAKETLLYKTWDDLAGHHEVTFTRGDLASDEFGSGKYLIVEQKTGSYLDWHLKDYLTECDTDKILDLANGSVELKDIFNDGVMTVLFAYRMGCAGGIDAVDFKYFAYHNGIKYSLRGEENLIVSNDDTKNDKPQNPVPDYNLRTTKPLLNYMINKWPLISVRKLP
ncbi:M949_RS01915 family surface polysaccharide biosynthesis protein [Enterobacter ludwigii]|uniref:M949_RS01915 family surface polysaccharide biosynthesis protein n=1 Tax=Enterobacter ludwigii TaxID=299767 RepID=UPI003F71BAD0